MAIYMPIVSEFKSTGIDKAKKEFKSLEGAGAKAGFLIRKAAIPATAAIGALAAGLFDAARGAMEDEAAATELARSLRQTAGATEEVIKANEDWITQQGILLGVSDAQLRPALSKLARATGDVSKAQRIATQAMDIAAATGKPLETVTEALSKALGGNMTALSRLAPEFRNMVKEGKSFDEIMAAMSVTMGGAATEAANTAEGQFKRFGLAMDETKESIGAALLPAIEAVLPYLNKFATWAQQNPQTFLIIAGALGAIAGSIVAINIAMSLNPITAIAAGIIALGAALVLAYNKFEGFRNIVNAVFDGLKAGVALAIDNFKMMLNVWKTVFNGIARLWNSTLGELSVKIPDIPGLPGRGQTFGIPKIPMLADGGLVQRPTLAVVGESGPEVVIPLDRLGAMAGGGGMNITVNAGLVSTPDQIGQEIIQAIQKAQRRSGVVFAPAL